VTATRLRDLAGAAVGLVVAHRDVTEQRKLRARVALAERLASLGTLVAGIAHEINNPLSFVLANLHYLEAEPRTPVEDMQVVLAETIDGANRIARIVRNLKQFSRPEKSETPQPVDLRRPIERACALSHNHLRHRAQLVTHLEEVPPVMGDEGQVCQVVLNLLTNAAEAIPEGQRDQTITLALEAREGWAVLSVSDTGRGMSREVQSQLFTPFFTTRPQDGGTGLGLSICFGIVEALGGRLEVSSAEGVGSRFEVWLPIAGATPRSGAPRPSATPPVAQPLSRVLVVDDDPNVLTALSRVLRHEHQLVPVSNGDDALTLLRDGQRFDAVLCDLMMPGMSGIDLFEQASAHAPDVARRFVFMTGGAFSPRADHFTRSCEQPTITKPFDLAELRAVLRERRPLAAA
jgi:nitrogen-specific signal transduction histidine kinase/CheY-like chemotaxis protein